MDTITTLLVFLALMGILGTAAWASFRAAPFVPLGAKDVRRMISLAALKDGDRLADLGCGDGRLLFAAAAAKNITAIGYEVSVIPYVLAHLRRLMIPNRHRVRIRFADFLRADLRTIDVFTCFLTPMAMEKLKTTFDRQAKDGARIVSYAFPVPGWVPDVEDKPNPRTTRIFVYTIRQTSSSH